MARGGEDRIRPLPREQNLVAARRAFAIEPDMTAVIRISWRGRTHEGQPIGRNRLCAINAVPVKQNVTKAPPIIKRHIDERSANLRPRSVKLHHRVFYARRAKQALLREGRISLRAQLGFFAIRERPRDEFGQQKRRH